MSVRLDRRLAWFALSTAIDSGFTLTAGVGDSLDAIPPADMGEDIAGPIVSALRTHEPQVVGFLKFLAAEEAAGRHWSPGRRGVAQ